MPEAPELSGIFGVSTAFAPSYEIMVVLRFCCGVAFGGNLPLAVSILTEFMPQTHRSRSLVLLQLFMEAPPECLSCVLLRQAHVRCDRRLAP